MVWTRNYWKKKNKKKKLRLKQYVSLHWRGDIFINHSQTR